MDQIRLNEDFNCRGFIRAGDVIDLVKSFKSRTANDERPLISPINVMERVPNSWTDLYTPDRKYIIIAGHRRYRAHEIAKYGMILCIIEPFMNEFTARAFNLRENTDRKDLDILQEAQAIKYLRRAALPEIVTQEELAELLNVSRGWVQNRVALLGLPEDIQREVATGMIKQTDIQVLIRIQKTHGNKALYESARQLIDNTVKGTKKEVDPLKKRTDIARARSKQEIIDFIPHILIYFDSCLASRVLAWAAGEISTDVVCTFLAKEVGDDYEPYE